MKKEYIKSQTDVIELKMTTQVLVGSPDTIPLSPRFASRRTSNRDMAACRF